MIKSAIKTDYILLKANTNDEFEMCNCCIIKLKDETINKLLEYYRKIQEIKKLDDFPSLDYISLNFKDVFFINFDDDYCDGWLIEFIRTFKKNWCYVELTEEEIKKLIEETPIQEEARGVWLCTSSYIQIHHPGGYFKFIGFSDNSELYSYELDLNKQ